MNPHALKRSLIPGLVGTVVSATSPAGVYADDLVVTVAESSEFLVGPDGFYLSEAILPDHDVRAAQYATEHKLSLMCRRESDGQYWMLTRRCQTPPGCRVDWSQVACAFDVESSFEPDEII